MDKSDIDFLLENRKPELTSKEKIYKYLSYWKFFITSLFLCIVSGLLYIRYVKPKFNVSTQILVKTSSPANSNSNANSNLTNSSADLIATALIGGNNINIDNELHLIRSLSLIERVVAKHQFNISYFHIGKIKRTEIYNDAPLRLISQDNSDSYSPFNIIVKNLTKEGGVIDYILNGQKESLPFKWNNSFKVNGKKLVLVINGTIDSKNSYLVSWQPVKQASDDILENLTAEIPDKKTTIIELVLLTENTQRGTDILNALTEEYNLSSMEEKNYIAQSTIRFINERLAIVSSELGVVEGNLEDYQGNQQLVDVERQSTQSLQNSNEISKNLSDINIQINIVDMLQNYISNASNQDNLVPSNLGVNDLTLTSLISQYNQVQQKKNKEKPLLSPNSLVLEDLNNQLKNLKVNILELLGNIRENLAQQSNQFLNNNQKNKQFLSSIPHKERMLQEMKRKQGITQNLYLYLLQKREEAAVSASAYNVSNFKEIDGAKIDGQVEPKKKIILMLSVIVGLLIPVMGIKIQELFNDKIRNKKDVINKLRNPIIGEIAHISKQKAEGLSIFKDDLLEEQFRTLRTNLALINKNKGNKAILVTSSNTNEGKTFISINLAATLAISGNKVALIDFDTRQPAIAEKLDLQSQVGLVDFLTGKCLEISCIYQVLDELPSLHVYTSGKLILDIPDLLRSNKIDNLFKVLRDHYDYIIFDTPPVGIVSDSLILGQYCDLVLCVIRQLKTSQHDLDFLNEVSDSKKLENIALIINDIKSNAKHGYKYNQGNGYMLDYIKAKKIMAQKN